MHDRIEPSIRDRVKDAVNVSSALDNCFFHSYAAYLLSNHLPLPQDLFLPVSENQGSPAEQLKKIFKHEKDLDIFDTYQQMTVANAEPCEMLVEKTLVLGVLFREWFVDNLLKDEANKERLFRNGDPVSFLTVIKAVREFGLDTVSADDRMAPIVEANAEFFNDLSLSTQADEEQQFHDYWEQQGYKRYCEYLANPRVKVSFTDVDPVLKAMDVPYVIYSKQDCSLTASHEGDVTKPKFELAIAAREGHYYLLKDSATEESLNTYAASLLQYEGDREEILRLRTKELRLQACEDVNSQLISMSLPKGSLSDNPIQLLIDSVENIKSATLARLSQPEATAQPLSVKENQVIDATIATQSDPEKSRQYKAEVSALILAGQKSGFFANKDNPIPIDELDSAEALEGESDEDFAKRLQEAEFRKVGLK